VTGKTQHVLIERLVDIQRTLNLSGSEVARRLGVNPSTWTRLVSGEMQPSLRVVQSAVAAFPELRSFCVGLLLIRSTDSSDRERFETPASEAV
jgi:transcriptional regulator with XRE-family HTH domain